MLRNFAFTAVNVVPQAQVDGRDPQAHTEPPITNGLNHRPQVITLGADAQHITSTEDQTTESKKGLLPMWIWYVAAAVIAYLVFKK